MNGEVDVEQVFDSILETWVAWGTSSGDPVDEDTLTNANLMHVDLLVALTLELGRVASRMESSPFIRAVNEVIEAVSDLHEHQALAASTSRRLDPARIERKRVELGFDPKLGHG